MSSSTDWNSNIGGGFGSHQPQDEFFHGTGVADDSLSETWFWNFHVAEANINCFAYCWVHPNLGLVTGGLMIYQGIKSQHLECELFEMRDFMPIGVIGDGSDIHFPNGMRVRVIEPLRRLHFSFEDAARDSRVDVTLDAVADPVMRANNLHFEQLMHATGRLRLRGQEYDVDCFAVRDRSWGEARPEMTVPAPPYTWVTGSFGSDFSFNIGAHDDPARDPDWQGLFPVPERVFKDGWVLIGAEKRRIVNASKTTRRSFPLCQPVTHLCEFEDESGDRYRIEGRLIAQSNWAGWSNANVHLGLVEWTWNGRRGWGESQEVQWNDYVWRMNSLERRG